MIWSKTTEVPRPVSLSKVEDQMLATIKAHVNGCAWLRAPFEGSRLFYITWFWRHYSQKGSAPLILPVGCSLCFPVNFAYEFSRWSWRKAQVWIRSDLVWKVWLWKVQSVVGNTHGCTMDRSAWPLSKQKKSLWRPGLGSQIDTDQVSKESRSRLQREHHSVRSEPCARTNLTLCAPPMRTCSERSKRPGSSLSVVALNHKLMTLNALLSMLSTWTVKLSLWPCDAAGVFVDADMEDFLRSCKMQIKGLCRFLRQVYSWNELEVQIFRTGLLMQSLAFCKGYTKKPHFRHPFGSQKAQDHEPQNDLKGGEEKAPECVGWSRYSTLSFCVVVVGSSEVSLCVTWHSTIATYRNYRPSCNDDPQATTCTWERTNCAL